MTRRRRSASRGARTATPSSRTGPPATVAWPAPGLRCWSMIGKVGNGAAFEVGTAKTFRAADAGPLLLGINDNFVRDNKGHWFATVTLNKPGAVTTPTTPAAAPGASSNTTLFVLVGALLLLVVLLVIVVAARRRKGDARRAGAGTGARRRVRTARSRAPAGRHVAAGRGAHRRGAARPSRSTSTSSRSSSRTGSRCGSATTTSPRAPTCGGRSRRTASRSRSGRFVTKGGGSTNHFETVPLGVKLEGRDTQPDGADVQFDWMINDVPFRYSVRSRSRTVDAALYGTREIAVGRLSAFLRRIGSNCP